jgi:hypothetical protein
VNDGNVVFGRFGVEVGPQFVRIDVEVPALLVLVLRERHREPQLGGQQELPHEVRLLPGIGRRVERRQRNAA